MRTWTILVVAGCSIPDKQLAIDAGTDAPVDLPGGAPDTAITSAPAELSRATSATFRFSSDHAGAHFECSIDEDTPVACTSPYTRVLGDGPHAFAARAIDPDGRADPTPAEHRWWIDTVAPETFLVATPPLADNSVVVTFDFESDEDAVFECAVDGGGFAACEPGARFGPLGDGAHAFAVRARDRAGNVDASPAIYAWQIDTGTPDTVIASGPDAATASTSATFAFVSPDAGAGVTFQCALDGAAFTACTSPRSYSGLTAGAHHFGVRARDAVGNLDPTPATRDWVVDLVAPNTTIIAGPAGVVPSASASFAFVSNESDVTFECSLDAAAFVACTAPHTLLALAQGPHVFAVRARDAAGHVDATPATRTWSVDTIPPVVSFTAGPSPGDTSGPRVIFAFVASEGTTACGLDGAAFAACTSPAAFSLPAGAHELRVRATDAAGNTATRAVGWTVACAAPSVAGAAGLLHLDDATQSVPDAVGGPGATLGRNTSVEAIDPTPGAGRFGGGLGFAANPGDLIAWPALLGDTQALTFELWARPEATAGTHAVAASGDGRFAIRVTAASPTTVRFTVAVRDRANQGEARVVISAPVAAGAWHHVLASLVARDLRLWVDGVRTDGPRTTLSDPLAFNDLQLGGDYDGAIDEVWLALTAITEDEAVLGRYCPP